jgi:hypothetical protein
MNNNVQENDQVNIQVYCTNIYNEALDFVKENWEEHFEGGILHQRILHQRIESGYNDLKNLENANDIKNDNNGIKLMNLLMKVIRNIQYEILRKLEDLPEDDYETEIEYNDAASHAKSILTALRRYCINQDLNNGGKRKRKKTSKKKNTKKNNTKRKRTNKSRRYKRR